MSIDWRHFGPETRRSTKGYPRVRPAGASESEFTVDLIRMAILGLGLGGAYALLTLGVVAIYRGTGVPNFAHGAVAMFSAFVFFDLRDKHHVSSWLAAAAAIVTAIARRHWRPAENT